MRRHDPFGIIASRTRPGRAARPEPQNPRNPGPCAAGTHLYVKGVKLHIENAVG